MMELEYLITEAKTLKGCDPGIGQLRGVKNVADLIQCYYDRIDYCLANDFPSNDFLLQYRTYLGNAGVFVNEKINIENRNKLVLLGQSECKLMLNKWVVCRAYVKHKSKLHLLASGNSIIMVDALDEAEIIIEESESARVIVNLYANARHDVITGNPRVTKKNRFTYEL